MAVTDRNIVITPNRTATGSVQPKIVFTGADSNIGDSSAITLFANPQNSGTLSFSGTAGQLFSITNDLTGTIFSVNDISGIPSLSVNDQGIIQLAEFNGRVIIGDSIGSDDSVSALQISGALTADSATIAGNIRADGGNLIMGDEALSSNTAYVGMKTSYQSGSTDYMIISGNADGNTYVSAKNGSSVFIRAGGNVDTSQIGVSAAAAIAFGDFRFDSASAILFDKSDKSLNFGDNYEAKFGAGGDLRIYHNGSNSYIDEGTGTGALIFKSNIFSFRNAPDNQQMAIFNQGGNVRLFHNGADKFNTLSNGVLVYGTVNADSATFDKITISSTGTIPSSAITSGIIDSARLPTGTFTSGGGADSAAIIALVDSDYVQARSTGTRGTLNNVNSRLFTGDNTTTAFELLNTPADSDDVFVFVNGVLQHTNSYSISGNTVTLDTAPDLGSSIDIRSHLIKSENVSLRDYKKYVYTLGSTVDSVSGADSAGATLTYDAGLVDVYVNGARLVTDKDYTAGNGSQVVFDSALGAGNIVEVVSHSRASVFTPEITSADVSLSTTDSGQNIDSFAKASFRTFKFTAQISHGASNSFHSEEVLLVHNGTNVAMTTFGQVLLDSNLGSFDAFISGANVQVKFSPTKTNTTVKLRGVRTPV